MQFPFKTVYYTIAMNLIAIFVDLTLMGVVVAEIPDPARSDDRDYCKEEFKCDETKHYACEHKEQTSSRWKNPYPYCQDLECRDIKASISTEQRSILLEKVNNFRNNVAGGKAGLRFGGSNIRQLSWDYKLEQFAKLYGTNDPNDGNLAHKPWIKNLCVKTKELMKVDGLYAVAGWYNNSSPEISSALKLWTAFVPSRGEVGKFHHPGPGDTTACPGPSPAPTRPPPAGNKYSWTILAWASATKMGCAFAKMKCHTAENPSATTIAELICFFGDGVNTEAHAVFKEGDACSACPKGTECKPLSSWPNLCATPEEPIFPHIPDSSHLHHAAASTHSLTILAVINYYETRI